MFATLATDQYCAAFSSVCRLGRLAVLHFSGTMPPAPTDTNEPSAGEEERRRKKQQQQQQHTHTHKQPTNESGQKTRQLVFRTVTRSPAHTYTHGVLYSASWLSAILISTSLQPKFHIARIVLVSFPSTTPPDPIPGHSFSATHPPNRKSVPTYWTNFRLHGRIAQTMCQCCHSYYRSKQVTKSNKNRFRY